MKVLKQSVGGSTITDKGKRASQATTKKDTEKKVTVPTHQPINVSILPKETIAMPEPNKISDDDG